jgi:cytochrome c553
MNNRNLSQPILSFYFILIFCFPQSVCAENLVPVAAESCSTCHSEQSRSENTIPSINGFNQSELLEILNKYKNGELSGTIMNRLIAGLTDQDILKISKYFGN